MGSGNEDTGPEQRRPAGHRAGVVDPGDPFDVPPGPEGWEAFRIRTWLWRLKQAEEEGRSVSGPPGKGIPAADRPRPLPPVSDLEDLVSDVLTAAYGPPVVEGVPEHFRGDLESLEALRRLRVRRARADRRAALARIARRFQRPIPPGRWKIMASEVVREYGRREEQEDRLTPWWVRPDAPREAMLRATALGVADERVRTAAVGELAGRLKTAIGDALGSDLLAPEWMALTEKAEKRRPPPADLDDVPETALSDLQPHENPGQLAALVAAEEGRDPIEELQRLATARQSEQLEEVRRHLRDGLKLAEAKRRAAEALGVSVNALDVTFSRLRSKVG